MKRVLPLLSAGWLVLSIHAASAATYKWSGMRIPPKISAEDGVTKLVLQPEEGAHAIFNVNNRFQGSRPWATFAVGVVPDAPASALEAQEQFLSRMDGLGVDIFLEIYPRKTNDVSAAIDTWLGKFKAHALLAKLNQQEIGLLWVCVKSGKSYNANWDLTRGATLLAAQPGGSKVLSASPPPIRADAPLDRMTVLFDGNSLEGWSFNSSAWSIVDGAMRGTGKGGNIFTKADYGDFRLLFTSRVASPEGNPGRDHLGALFWGERATNFGTGKALQVQPPHGAMWDYRTNRGLKPEHPAPRPRPRYQDWHVCEILAKLDTGEVRVAVDGLEVTKCKHPDPSVLKRGPVGMQIHAAVGIFDHKDIRIEADPAEDRLITVK